MHRVCRFCASASAASLCLSAAQCLRYPSQNHHAAVPVPYDAAAGARTTHTSEVEVDRFGCPRPCSQLPAARVSLPVAGLPAPSASHPLSPPLSARACPPPSRPARSVTRCARRRAAPRLDIIVPTPSPSPPASPFVAGHRKTACHHPSPGVAPAWLCLPSPLAFRPGRGSALSSSSFTPSTPPPAPGL